MGSFGSRLSQISGRYPVMDLRVGQVGKLVGPPGIGNFGGEAIGHPVAAFSVICWDPGGRDHDLGTVRTQQPDLLTAHLVGHHEDATVSLDGRRHGQPDTGVARRRLDDRSPWPQPVLPFGLIDHRNGTWSSTLPPGLLDSTFKQIVAQTETETVNLKFQPVCARHDPG